MHDHTEPTVTNKGISPGGDITTIVYDGFMEANELPKVATNLERFFDPDYYRGKMPVFDPEIFHTTRRDYEYGWSEKEPVGGKFGYVAREDLPPLPRQSPIEGHQIVANSCERPRGFQRIEMKGGVEVAREGEVFAFEPRVIRAGRCEEIEIVLENTDAVRHALMLPGLNPMFTLEFTGPGRRTARFVTPDEDVTLEFHCHVETHEKMGMHGLLIVGEGGREPHAAKEEEEGEEAARHYVGVGVILEVDPRAGRLIIDHEEIPRFMAPMVMSYQVRPAGLLQGVEPGEEVEFTIDAERRAIVEIVPAEG